MQKNEPDKAASSLGRGRGFGTKKAASTERPVCSPDSARHLLSVEGWGRERASGGREPSREEGRAVSGGCWMLQREGCGGRAGGHSACVPGGHPQGPCGGKRGAGGGQEGSVPVREPIRGCRPRAPVLISVPLSGGREGKGPAGGPEAGVAWRGVAELAEGPAAALGCKQPCEGWGGRRRCGLVPAAAGVGARLARGEVLGSHAGCVLGRQGRGSEASLAWPLVGSGMHQRGA